MALKQFSYKKKDGSVSSRVVYPMAIVDDKVFAVDLSEYSPTEIDQYNAILEQIHKQYINAIREVGLGSNFRYFLIEGMKNV